MATPYVSIDLDKIEHNATTIVSLCQRHGIEVSGVTKVTCGNPEVANAMLRGGVSSIADSRLQNLRRLKQNDIADNFMLLRVPAVSEVAQLIDLAQVSLNSELSVLQALSRVASQRKMVHEVILLTDLGDLREGVLPGELNSLVGDVVKLPGIRLKGIGTNLACLAGVVPSKDNMNQLVDLADTIEQQWDLQLEWISGINSSGLDLIASGNMPERVNHARIGEAILLGCETTQRRPWPHAYQDAFVLHAEIIELKRKPSLPTGQCGEDAFGQQTQFEDKGLMLRALLNVGREDVDIHGIKSSDPNITILGGSSGYLVMDVTAASNKLSVGDELTFIPNYSALLTMMTSEYVEKRIANGYSEDGKSAV